MERNLIGEMNMMNGGGPQPADAREGRQSGFDRYRAEIEEKAAMPGMTKKALHELLLHRHGGDEPPVPGYNAYTHYLRRNAYTAILVIPGSWAFARITSSSGSKALPLADLPSAADSPSRTFSKVSPTTPL